MDCPRCGYDEPIDMTVNADLKKGYHCFICPKCREGYNDRYQGKKKNDTQRRKGLAARIHGWIDRVFNRS